MYTYPPLSIDRNSFIQLSELEQCRVKKLAQGFNATAQDSNQGPLSRVRSFTPEPLRSINIIICMYIIYIYITLIYIYIYHSDIYIYIYYIYIYIHILHLPIVWNIALVSIVWNIALAHCV